MASNTRTVILQRGEEERLTAAFTVRTVYGELTAESEATV